MQPPSLKVSCIAVLFLASLVQPVAVRATELSDIKALAEKGDAVAQDKLGNAYIADFDYATAAEWYRKSAMQGNAHAQTELGRILIGGEPAIKKGQAVAANAPEGAGWFLKAANQDYIDAQYEVGRCCRDGKGLSADPVEAFKWFDLATKKGHTRIADAAFDAAQVGAVEVGFFGQFVLRQAGVITQMGNVTPKLNKGRTALRHNGNVMPFCVAVVCGLSPTRFSGDRKLEMGVGRWELGEDRRAKMED
jgi:hypothetical protein